MLPTEPLSIGGVLDAGVRVYRQTLPALLVPALVCGVLMAALGLAATNSMDFSAAGDQPIQIGPTVYLFGLLNILAFVFFLLVVARRQWGLMRGEQRSVAEDFLRGAALLIPIVVATLLYILCISLGFVLLVIPGMILTVSMGLYLFVPIVEERGAWLAAIRSHQLVWNGNWFRTAAVFTVNMAMVFAISFAFELVAGGAQGFQSMLEPTQPSAIYTIISTLVSLALYPLVTAIDLVLYNDLLLRSEAGDLDAKLQSLDAG